MTKDTEIEMKYLDQMQALARAIDEIFNGEPLPSSAQKKTGFFLMVFPFEGFDGRANYISNCDRRDVIILLKEMTRRFEGQPEMKGHA